MFWLDLWVMSWYNTRMKNMTVEQFNKALQAGLGRCILFLEGCENKEPYREAVLNACLNDYAYDGQSEGTRAWYTYKLLSCFNDDEYFFSRIEMRLRAVVCRIGNNWDFEHLFDLMLEFARHGHDGAKDLILQTYEALLSSLADKTPEEDEIDYEFQWFEHICIEGAYAGGVSAAVNIAANLGELFSVNPEYSADDFFQYIELVRAKFGNEIDFTLMLYSEMNYNVKIFLQNIEQSETVELIGITDKKVKKDVTSAKPDKHKGEHACDVNKILSDIALCDNTDKDGDWHSVAMDISYDEDTVFPMEAYMYVYNGMCACCRKRVVEAMHKHGLLTDELLQECRYDCYDQTREWAERIIQN